MRVTYLFDPLCGWCYGAGPALEKLAQTAGILLQLAPTGLFADENARPINASFANFAWENDQRIARLTGQIFSEAYRGLIFDTPRTMFDSAPATLGVIAVGLTAPDREPEALKLLQQARYIDGRNTADSAVVSDVLARADFPKAGHRLSSPDDTLRDAYAVRIDAARRLMRRFGTQGVPALVVEDDRGERLVQGNVLYENLDMLKARLAAA